MKKLNPVCLVIIPYYGFTGSTLYISQYIKVLVRKNYNVQVLCRREDEGSVFLRKLGANVNTSGVAYNLNFTADDENSQGFIQLLRTSIKFFIGLFLGFYTILKYKPDLVIVGEHTLLQFLLVSKLFRKKTITLNQSTLTQNRIKKYFADRIIGLSDSFVGITPYQLNQHNGLNNKRTYVIHNSVFMNRGQSKDNFTYPSPYKKKHYQILFLNGLLPHKGALDFVKIAWKLLQSRNDINFIIIGNYNKQFSSNYSSGSMLTNYEYTKEVFNFINQSDLNDKVFVLGEKQNVYDYINDSDILLSLHKFPHFSRPIIEAFAFKKAVIAADDEYGRYLIEPDVNGILLNKNNLNLWIEKCNFLLDNPDFRKMIGENGYQRYVKDFSESVIQKQIEKFLEII